MILIHPIIRQQFFGSILQGKIQEFWKLINDVIASWLSKQNMLKLHLSYIELAIFRAQICLDIIDHGDAIFYPFSLVIVWNKRTTVGLSLCSYRPKKLPQNGRNLAFLWSMREKTKKNCWREKVIVWNKRTTVFLGLYSYRPQKWPKMVTTFHFYDR